jgi:uncharacterized membrane protein YkvA (DUF1232 family)
MANLFRRAEHLLRHPEELRATLGVGLRKAYDKRHLLFRVFEDFLMLFRLVKAWVMGEYREIPRTAVLWAILAILYFISPLDAIPDIFPGGYIDDIAFISFILRRIKADLDKFAQWEKAKKKEPK